jgi:methionyl-tRNA synthetase
MSRFYITTPIYYVSDVPHLGHAYTTVVADALARHRRLREGRDTVRFLTGTDDHGQKIARLAEPAGLSPQQFADKFADAYRTTWKALEIANDDFIRTTDADHEAVVQELWRKLEAQGDIYEGEYEGWYCVPCEQFYTEKELAPGNSCPVHGKPVEKLKEKSFFFRLSKYQQPLLDHYSKYPNFVQPPNRMNEVASFVREGLRDFSVSRTTFSWGVPVPGHPGHVVYVWIDALTNYYSATRRPALSGFWDDDVEIVHLIGKEISRFHAVYWPALLMAAGLRLPSTVYCHGWWTVNGEKMSKTLGNVVDPLRLSADIGTDAFRYFVLREVPLGLDGDFSHEALITRYNAELANDLGNLVNRTLGMVTKYFDGEVPQAREIELFTDVLDARIRLCREMDSLQPSAGLVALWGLVRRCNAYIDRTAPWSATRERRADILWNVLEALRHLSMMLDAFMPERAAEMRRQLGVEGPAEWPHAWQRPRPWRIGKPAPLFPRIDDERKAALLANWLPGATPASASTSASAPAASAPPELTFEEFGRLDLRVAQVRAAEPIAGASKLLKLTVDVGAAERQVVAGIAEAYRPEELVGKKVLFVANLKPATIRGVRSEGMILAAGDPTVVALAGLDRDAPPGTRVK